MGERRKLFVLCTTEVSDLERRQKVGLFFMYCTRSNVATIRIRVRTDFVRTAPPVPTCERGHFTPSYFSFFWSQHSQAKVVDQALYYVVPLLYFQSRQQQQQQQETITIFGPFCYCGTCCFYVRTYKDNRYPTSLQTCSHSTCALPRRMMLNLISNPHWRLICSIVFFSKIRHRSVLHKNNNKKNYTCTRTSTV